MASGRTSELKDVGYIFIFFYGLENRLLVEGKDEVINEFVQGNHAKGLVLGILHAGEKLKEYFPYGDKDENELSDEISKRH